MAHIFVSYDSRDEKLITNVIDELKKAGKKDWVDTKDIEVGFPYRENIDRALRSADAVIVNLTRHSVKNEYVTYEWAFALGAGVRLVPLLWDGDIIGEIHKRLQGLGLLNFAERTKPWGRLVTILSSKKDVVEVNRTDTKIPRIYAKFRLKERQPTRTRGSYDLLLSTRGVPNGTARVEYEIFDETFPKRERKFKSSKRDRHFEHWMNSYGDIFLSANGKVDGKKWQTQTTLVEALERSYPHPSPPIMKALDYIARH